MFFKKPWVIPRYSRVWEPLHWALQLRHYLKSLMNVFQAPHKRELPFLLVKEFDDDDDALTHVGHFTVYSYVHCLL